MAKQVGLIKFKGSLGDLSFYHSKDGYIVRHKGGADRQRIHTDPKFKRTREVNAEFKHASEMDKNLRMLLAPVIHKLKDSRLHPRIVSKMVRAIQADAINEKGKRELKNGDLSVFEGFEFNGDSNLASCWFGTYSTSLERSTGNVGINIPAFDAEEVLVAPVGSTHFRFVMGVLEWDIAGKKGTLVSERSAYLPKDMVLSTDVSLSGSISANTELPVFFILGIEFSQEVNGKGYMLSEGVGKVIGVRRKA